MQNKSENISRHCGRGPAIQGFYKEKTASLNRLDPGSMSGMTTKRAFTLIELLVVVLIIGILAAVAVPQYQKAVWKSRNVQLKVLVNAMIKAQNAYYLANGEYAKSLGDLGIDLPNWTSSKEANTYFTTTKKEDSVRSNGQILIGISQGFNNYAVWQDGPYQYGGFRGQTKISCIERNRDSVQEGFFCEKVEGAVYSTESDSWRVYTLP